MTNPLHNLSSADLADEYGTLKGQSDCIEKRLAAIKAELIARGVDGIEAPKFTLSISKQYSKRLDTKALKEALGDEICAEYERETESTVVRVKPTVIFGQPVAA